MTTSKNKEWLSCTTILYVMTILGFGTNYMLRMNITIAIVDMVKHSNTTIEDTTKFQWDTLQKNEILAVFFWGYSLTTFLGGRFGEKYGTRLIFGSAMFCSSIITICFPFICNLHYYFALASRFIMGVSMGMTFPSILPIAVSWIPPSDRSKFMSNIGAQGLGVAITLPISGYLITYLGWESVFYVTGSVGVLWSILWYFTIFDSPEVHPRISNEERGVIQNRMAKEMAKTGKKNGNVPWRSILTSMPVWASVVAQNTNMFYHFILTSQLPTYMNDVLHFNIARNGLVSCLPYIGQYTFCCCAGYLADKMIKSKKISTKNTRRIFTITSYIIPSILMYTLAFYKVHYLLAVTIITLIHTFKGSVTSAYASNLTDISPNYAGTILGSSMMIGSMGGWFGNKMVGLITKEASTFETWRTVFIIISTVNLFGCLSCTVVLYIVTIVGFGINYMLRVNISIAIVDMIRSPNQNETDIDTRFDWTVQQKTDVLAIFFWGYSTTVFFGGRLSEKYGTRLIMGNGILLGSLMTIMFPLMCKINFYLAVTSRFLLGVCLGVTFPSIMPLTVSWIPPMDRSKFASNQMAQSLGVAIAFPICGYLIFYSGWEVVFYFTGSVGLLWSLAWFYCIYDSPAQHPRISCEEKCFIDGRMKKEIVNNGGKPENVPWGSIFTSVPVWAIIIAQNGNTFYHFTYVNQLPTYMNDVLHFSISDNGLLSCLPFIGSYIFSITGSWIADKLRKSGLVSTKNTRKIFIVISFFIPSLLMLTLAFFKVNYFLAVVILTLMHSFKGCLTASYISNIMDIAPNFAGTILGCSLVMGSLSGWAGNKMAGFLTRDASNFETWRNVFIIISCVHSFGGLFFCIFASGKVQKWNQVSSVELKEMEPLKM
ncbi:unnamed protein product [Brassicogethes aeneus]|uniref:Uncharacterized protein n=1 Tax=Brassicogethes aeneus TaxID=1431903 RepID=A0A9P0FI19_BRAAE|nr:unnamed protein product [Brassicogethes aeneus]